MKEEDHESHNLPPGFKWGAATASYQIEGAKPLRYVIFFAPSGEGY